MIHFAGTVWRIMFAKDKRQAARPVTSPEGRFHHSGQSAIYTSLTQDGCAVAIRRYLRPYDPARMIVPLDIKAAKLADLRELGATPSVIWQDIRATGQPAPTWALSDAARDQGAQGLLYRSRSRPDLTHLVIFDLSVITETGAAQTWSPAP